MKESREPYNFSYETKIKALERSRYRCEQCGRTHSRKNQLEVHHVVAIWFAREVPALALQVITSIANAKVLCHSCHNEEHRTESRNKYQSIAPVVLQEYLSLVVDHSKDEWRKKSQELKGPTVFSDGPGS